MVVSHIPHVYFVSGKCKVVSTPHAPFYRHEEPTTLCPTEVEMRTLLLCTLALLVIVGCSKPMLWDSVPHHPGSGPVCCLAVNDTTLYAGTWDGGIYVSTDFGAKWTRQDTTGLPSDRRTWCLAVMPMGQNAVVLIASTRYKGEKEDNRMFRSSDKGISWTSCDDGLPENALATCFAVCDSTIFAGVWGRGVYLSTDFGKSWVSTNLGAEHNLWVQDLAVRSRQAGKSILAATDGGLLMSSNNGANWKLINSYETTCIGASNGEIYAGIRVRGVFLSTDNGTGWKEMNNGIPSGITDKYAVGVNSLAVSGDSVFVAIYSQGIFLSTDHGKNWTDDGTWGPNFCQFRSLTICGRYIFAIEQNYYTLSRRAL